MSLSLMITTVSAGFVFPFLIRLLWGRMCEDWGSIGGFMAAGFIVGTTWTLAHGVGLIYQSGGAWVDMAFAAASGLFVASLLCKDCPKRGFINVFFAIVGGIIGGFILSNLP